MYCTHICAPIIPLANANAFYVHPAHPATKVNNGLIPMLSPISAE
jgi:hypothetical protein